MRQATPEEREWIESLEALFPAPGGHLAARSWSLSDHEDGGRALARNLYCGFYDHLMSCFFDFAFHVFENATHALDTYDASLLVTSLWSIRSGYILFYSRYGCQAVGQLRTALESALLLTAENSGVVRRHKFLAVLKTDKNAATARRIRQVEARTRKMWTQVQRHMFGTGSGLSAAVQEDLARFIRVLHQHVHFASHSIFELMEEGESNKGICFYPELSDQMRSSFVVTSQAVSWLFLRLVWTKVPQAHHSDELKDKFGVLDGAFQFGSQHWQPNMASAWLAFLEYRLPRPPSPA